MSRNSKKPQRKSSEKSLRNRDYNQEPASVGITPEDSSTASSLHKPVLFSEVLSFLPLKPGLKILDGTLGLGGHSEGLLRLADESGFTDAQLLALDRDEEAIAHARERLAQFKGRVRLQNIRFSECAEALDEANWEKVDFALVDIGVSSMQIDSPERGFSFLADGPLDMRMDRSSGRPASTLVNKAPVGDLIRIISDLGEEPMAGKIARAIDEARAKNEISSTAELAAIVENAYPAKWRATARNHPATRTFQALRMAVNGELEELDAFLKAIVSRLAPGGRVAVITFHSLEDRMVKHFFRDEATGCRCPRHIPVCICGHLPNVKILTKKPVTAEQEELRNNPRASSAKLRVAEKL